MIGVGHQRPQAQQCIDSSKPDDPQPQAHMRRARNHPVQVSQHHAEDEAEHMRVGRIFQRPQPRPVAPPVRVRDSVGIEGHVECARNQPQRPHAGHLHQVRSHSLRALPLRHPWKNDVIGRLGRHRPRRRIQKSRHCRHKPLQQQRRQHHPRPEHGVCVRLVLRAAAVPGSAADLENRWDKCA